MFNFEHLVTILDKIGNTFKSMNHSGFLLGNRSNCKATVNGKLVASSINTDGLVTVSAASGENRIVITTKHTLLATIAAALSIFAYIYVILKYKQCAKKK